MTKRYDRAYFDHWYRSRATRVNSRAEVLRKVMMAVAVAEYFLRRPVRTVLDVGCGEGAWLSHLRTFRPRVQYTGFDSSDYVVERFGASRNIRKAAFGELPRLDLGVHDLVVCSDVLHYIPNEELRPGMRALAAATDGLAYLEVLTKEDDIYGDLDSLIHRPASFYRKLFVGAGLKGVAPYCWLGAGLADGVSALEAP